MITSIGESLGESVFDDQFDLGVCYRIAFIWEVACLIGDVSNIIFLISDFEIVQQS